ncbi:MAG: cytochrome b N-terminal domain-containing protein, partial [Anaerolineae bacterium]
MAKQPPVYTKRNWLRRLEKGWSRLEGFVNRVSTANELVRPYNPLYHLGTLAIFLLIVITVTGIYLTLLYRPGTDRAFLSVAAISDGWFGSLIRSIHRYASNGLILVTLLHALKTWLSDRFWGTRWLAWISGWVMLALFWIIGLMGYWLVWDQTAQWLTEYTINILKGTLAISFLGANIASGTFALFVIILFLHVFVPILLVLGIIIHVLRLARANYWAPRWMMGISLAALVILALARPFPVALPADLSRLVTNVKLDWLFMGFLPLAERLGNPVFWIGSVLLLAA